MSLPFIFILLINYYTWLYKIYNTTILAQLNIIVEIKF